MRNSAATTCLFVRNLPYENLPFCGNFACEKLPFCDIIFFNSFMNRKFTENELYRAVLLDRLTINEGMIMENTVAQSLRRNGHKLFFYSRSDTNHRENNIEIDFLIKKGKKICPIEVKSSEYRAHTSLDKFYRKFKDHLAAPIVFYQKDIMEKDGVLHLPLFMADFV